LADIFYLGRLAGLALYLLLVFYTIKTTPCFKKVFLFLALMPMAISQAASWNPDGAVAGFSFLFIAYTFYLAFSAKIEKVNFPQLFFIALLLILIAISKIVYFPLLLLFLLIPSRKFSSPLVKYGALAGIFLFIILSLTGWTYLNRDLEVYILSSKEQTLAQLVYLLHNPLQYLFTFFKTLTEYYTYEYTAQFYGVLGWLDNPLPYFLALVYIFTVAYLSLKETPVLKRLNILENKYSWSTTATIVATLFFSLLSMFTVIYLTWSSKEIIGGDRVVGIQGRYFLPLAPLFFFSLPFLKEIFRKRAAYLILLLSLFICVYFVYSKFH